jgi:hypothetical protein
VVIDVTPDAELAAESGTERADGREVNGEVNERHRKPGGSGEIPERAGAVVGVGQRKAEHERGHGDAADGHGRGAAMAIVLAGMERRVPSGEEARDRTAAE